MKEFKVGDRVKVINAGSSCNKVGEVGIITEIEDSAIRVQIEGNEDWANNHTKEQIEKI